MNTARPHPVPEWSDVLAPLSSRQRETVGSAIASSMAQGWTPSREHVEIMAAFAAGTISARDYALRTLGVLGIEEPAEHVPPYVAAARPDATREARAVDVSADTLSFARGELDVDEWVRRASAKLQAARS